MGASGGQGYLTISGERVKKFELNIEKVLEDRGVQHGLREVSQMHLMSKRSRKPKG